MFQHHCTACDRHQLIFPSQVVRLTNTEHGILLDVTCWCGAPGAVLTGNAAAGHQHAA